ncbi:hypothetical protein E4T47_00937 [Aureobasidium subglaciale]|nr:hypothetical protein E4T47_00937 [Aureobasidium subglaciale]
MSRNILPASLSASCTSLTRPSSYGPSPAAAQWQPVKVKKLTGSACEYCRKRRRKCNGEQPCPLCVDNNQECIYEVTKTETQGQAVKRKHAQMQQDHDELKSLFAIYATGSNQKTLEIHNRIRSGQSPGAILQQLKHGDILIQSRLNSERHVRHVLLSSLMQTNASFDDLVDFIGLTVVKNPNAQVPTAALLRQLRGQQTDLKGLRSLLGYAQPASTQRRIAISDLLSDQGSPASESGSSRSESLETENSKISSEPPYRLPAKPWTTLTDDDDLVTHLVSLYMEWVNPFFRPLEEDLFVAAMQAGDLTSEYCSPFLVNSILAYACLYSEREGAFFQPDDYLTRGQQFHNEAFRLWQLEEGRATLTNLQALAIMYPGCILRGKDKLGMFLRRYQRRALHAFQQVKTCWIINEPEKEPLGLRLLAICMTPLAESAVLLADPTPAYRATANTILQPASNIKCKDDLPTAAELMISPSRVWTGYPHHNKDHLLDTSALWVAHCRLTQLTWKAQRLLYASDRSDPLFPVRVEALTEEMNGWKRALPESLHFRGRLPAPVYDLHSCYAAVIIALYSLFQPIGASQSSSTGESSPIQEIHSPETTLQETIRQGKEANTRALFARVMRDRAIATAQEMAVKMGNFRHHYGLKIIPPYFVQANGVVCFTLLQDLANPASAAAFKEAFRCLLGAGMQLLWARGMARMLHLTAQNIGIQLPKAIETMLEAVADTAWKKSDTEMLSSCWPNYAIAKDAKVGESVMMEDLIKKWERVALDEEEGRGKRCHS